MAYSVIVNSNDEAYKSIDPITGEEMLAKFPSKKKAEAELQNLLEEAWLEPNDGWHIDAYAQYKERKQNGHRVFNF